MFIFSKTFSSVDYNEKYISLLQITAFGIKCKGQIYIKSVLRLVTQIPVVFLTEVLPILHNDSAAVRPQVVILLLLIHCLLLLSFFVGPSFVLQHFMSFLVGSHFAVKERAG